VSESKVPTTLPAKFMNTDPAWVDEQGVVATPRGLDFMRGGGSNTLHVRKQSYGGETSTLCGTGGFALDLVEYLGRPRDGERTWTVCAKCRKLWAEGKR
jgi:hypothetical protein